MMRLVPALINSVRWRTIYGDVHVSARLSCNRSGNQRDSMPAIVLMQQPYSAAQPANVLWPCIYGVNSQNTLLPEVSIWISTLHGNKCPLQAFAASVGIHTSAVACAGYAAMDRLAA